MKRQIQGMGRMVGGLIFVAVVLLASGAGAEQMTSPSYILNGNAGGSFGGTISSPNYNMTSIGGEAVVGNGSSSSYILDQQWPTQSVTPTMQLSVQPSGLVGYWPLDEGTGTTTADASRYQHNGTLQPAADWYGSGQMGASVDMHGPADLTGNGSVQVPDNPDLPNGSAMTVELWARQASWVGNQAFASHWDYVAGAGGSGSWALQTGINNNLRVFIATTPGDDGENYVDTDANTWNTFNTWRHIALVFDGTQASASNRVKIYLDGVQLNTTAYGTIPTSLLDSSGAFSIGSFPGLGRALMGAIDHVKLFNRALSSTEIAAEYTAQAAGIPAGTTLGTISTSSTTSLVDVAVRTNSTSYSLSASQDHNLQSGVNTIPAVTGSIASPTAWSEGATVGLGFTILSAPTLDSKWGSGANYAAFPGSGAAFYSEANHTDASVVDVVGMRLRLGIDAAQSTGAYSNTITYTGTTLP